jgi:hypothetical protein
MKLRAAASFYAALILALGGFAGSALAGDHGNGNGNGNSSNNSSNAASSTSPGHSDHGQSQSTTTSTGGDNSTGVKPSNTTKHDTHAAASSDKTKKYGNGKTAGQIATQAGYGNSTLHGPGNSQPHKVNCGGHEVDVHALKNKKCGDVKGDTNEEHSTTTTTTTTTTTPAPPERKVTICHKTGSATNPYVEITVDEHALKDGHTVAKGDIIPAPAGGCPTAQVLVTTTTTAAAAAVAAPSTAAPSTAAPSTAAPSKPAAAPAGAVLGAVTALHPVKAKPAGGVLGTTVRLGKKVSGTTLPFTGLPLWIFALVAAGLILIGATARRAGAER